MKKLLILTLVLFSYSAVAADIYEFNSGNSSAPAPAQAARAKPATETKVVRHQQGTKQGGEAPVTAAQPGTVVGQDAIAHVHDCAAGAACNDLH